MTYYKIATIDATANHYGSAVSPPIASTISTGNNNFVMINGRLILTTSNLINTPSHMYSVGPPPLYHSHSNQIVDNQKNKLLKINGEYILLETDKNNANDTRIDVAGQNLVMINV